MPQLMEAPARQFRRSELLLKASGNNGTSQRRPGLRREQEIKSIAPLGALQEPPRVLVLSLLLEGGHAQFHQWDGAAGAVSLRLHKLVGLADMLKGVPNEELAGIQVHVLWPEGKELTLPQARSEGNRDHGRQQIAAEGFNDRARFNW